jgi:hypothetical protein
MTGHGGGLCSVRGVRTLQAFRGMDPIEQKILKHAMADGLLSVGAFRNLVDAFAHMQVFPSIQGDEVVIKKQISKVRDYVEHYVDDAVSDNEDTTKVMIEVLRKVIKRMPQPSKRQRDTPIYASIRYQ